MDNYLEQFSDLLYAPGEIRACCPLCGEQNHKLYVQDDYPYLWHCKHCDEYGNAISLIKKVDGCDFKTAKEILAENGVDIDDQEISDFNKQYGSSELTEQEQLLLAMHSMGKKKEQEDTKLVCPPLPEGFKTLASQRGNPETYAYLAYLKNRGVTIEQIYQYQIGYTERFSIISHKGNEVPITNMLVFPTFDDNGNCQYWNTRCIYDSFFKTLNAPSKQGEYSKDNSIFNLNNAKRTPAIVICESVFNALTIGISGVATFGKQVTADQLKLLREAYKANNAIQFFVFLDSDANKQAALLGDKLLEFTKNVFVVNNPTEYDVNDMGHDRAMKMLSQTKPYTKQSELQLLMRI